MDEHLRRLERAAATGDPEAAQRLRDWRRRLGLFHYYVFRQNNVRGLWRHVPEKGIGRHIIIEAFSQEEAEEHLHQIIGETTSGDWCECCGSRWPSIDEDSIYPSTQALREYGGMISESIPDYWRDTYLHYHSGVFRVWRPRPRET